MCARRFQALYSYVPQNDDELELQEGDLVNVMEKCDDGWFVGMSVITVLDSLLNWPPSCITQLQHY